MAWRTNEDFFSFFFLGRVAVGGCFWDEKGGFRFWIVLLGWEGWLNVLMRGVGLWCG